VTPRWKVVQLDEGSTRQMIGLASTADLDESSNGRSQVIATSKRGKNGDWAGGTVDERRETTLTVWR